MVITEKIDSYKVKGVLVDQGSSTNVLYYNTFQKLSYKDEQM
ncbi:hypothetical protein G2W53_035311 [Senna tora]|uniref:Uncharacterized protein n=1 Tax=Senna tora TaxID=362788 RepID=A0A834SPX1_9FABA|nr:hypothetical protein G2W53_035311 [Senna tora]